MAAGQTNWPGSAPSFITEHIGCQMWMSQAIANRTIDNVKRYGMALT